MPLLSPQGKKSVFATLIGDASELELSLLLRSHYEGKTHEKKVRLYMKSVGQPLPESGEGEEGGPPAPKKAKASSGPAFPQQMCEPCGVNLTSQIQADQHYQVGF